MPEINYDKDTILVVKIAILACSIPSNEGFPFLMSDRSFVEDAIKQISAGSKINLGNFVIMENQTHIAGVDAQDKDDFFDACEELCEMDDLKIANIHQEISNEDLTRMARNSIQKMIEKTSLTNLEYICGIISTRIGEILEFFKADYNTIAFFKENSYKYKNENKKSWRQAVEKAAKTYKDKDKGIAL